MLPEAEPGLNEIRVEAFAAKQSPLQDPMSHCSVGNLGNAANGQLISRAWQRRGRVEKKPANS